MDASIKDLKEQAIYLGLAGDDIPKYVLNQQTLLRDERAKERELKQSAMAAEAEKQRLTNEAEKIRLAHELELAKVRASSNSIITEGPVKPTLPVFKDGEDIASWSLRTYKLLELRF